MNLSKINKKLQKTYGGKVSARYNPSNNSIVVEGNLSDWNDIVSACTACVVKDRTVHIVNHITLEGVKIPKMKIPQVMDTSLEGKCPDVLIIGGGISGTSIARELSKWDIDILLVEKESDLAMQASGRNDGEVHPGVDLGKGSLKQKYVLEGNRIYEDICRELDVPFRRNGQYVGFRQGYLKGVVKLYAAQRRHIGVKDTRVISREELLKAQPQMDKDFKFGLYNSSAGTVCPYGLTIAYAENAVSNGATVSLNTAVLFMNVKDGKIQSVVTNRGTIYPKIVINAAGVFADSVAKMANDEFFSIHPRRGTNSILDKKANYLSDAIVSWKGVSLKKTHTKGGGIIRTVDDNMLIGPDAVETFERENFATHRESIKNVFNKQRLAVSRLSEGSIITYFTGVRAPTFEEDFIIEKGRECSNIIHCAGIQSPGLTTAPVVAKDIEKMAVDMLGNVKRNENYNPVRKGIPRLRELDDEARNEMIRQNPDYGVMVCRCEEISKGEIIDALKSNICVPTLDGIKRRVRPGMGRCQGGFCSPVVLQIIAEFTGKNISDIKKNNDNSVISYGKLK